jgi:hypothetical protein
VTLPAIVPPPFKDLSAAEREVVDLAIPSLTVAVTKAGPAVSFGGTFVAKVKLFGNAADVKGTLAITRLPDGTDIAVTGETTLDVRDLFGLSGVRLQALGVDATLSDRAGKKSLGFGLQARVDANGLRATARVGVRMSGTRIRELALGLVGAFPIKLPGGTEALTITNPEIGLMTESGEGFIGGALEWRKQQVTGVLYARKAPTPGLALFLKVDGLRLRQLIDRAPVDFAFPTTWSRARSRWRPSPSTSCRPARARCSPRSACRAAAASPSPPASTC